MDNSSKRIFITGIAGFIGFHLAKALRARGDFVFGVDNFNDYYDPALKKLRASQLDAPITNCDLSNRSSISRLLDDHSPTHIVHLAAQAGIRMSLTHPEKYQEANSQGFFHLLECCKSAPDVPIVFASSSSVYGLNKKIPFSETDPTDSPANVYGATKKANEVLAHAYHNVHNLHLTGLRFFTVYGPYGRPDMAYSLFADAIANDEPIRLYNNGKMKRDFTYIDDIIDGTIAAIDLASPFEIFNLGNNQPEEVRTLISLIEEYLGKKAIIQELPMPPGEIETTYADIDKAKRLLNFDPKTPLVSGLQKTLGWHFSPTPPVDIVQV